MSRPTAGLHRAEALVLAGDVTAAAAQLRAAILEPVGRADLPWALVPRIAWIQGLIAAAAGDAPLARARFEESAQGWRTLIPSVAAATADGYNASLVDLGRPRSWGSSNPAQNWPESNNSSGPWTTATSREVISMPIFALSAHSQAPVEEVWKLLHDPTRFPEWWEGIDSIAPGSDGDYTMWPAGYPDFPMAQHLDTERLAGRLTISCLVSDLIFRWQLHEAGETTDIEVEVDVPEHEAHRLPDQRRLLEQSLRTLAALAARTTY